MATEQRHQPDVLKQYEGPGITVHWEPNVCIHVSNCIRAVPGVFKPDARPWVNVEGASADEIAAAIESCPTGALSYLRTDGGPQEAPESPTKVEPRPNGPLFVHGDIEVIDAEGNVTRRATRIALCRCGQSRNKPYCDLSHRAVGFKS
jgi:uncharacterized Fe-S cluster protein YjdI/CDGSH-type Zn-finger protein